MPEFFDAIRDDFERFNATAAVDVLLVAAALYWLLLLLRGTTAMTLLRGGAILLLVTVVLARAFDLQVLNFIVRNSVAGILIAVVVIFQPEIRRALERVGRTGLALGRHVYSETIDAVARAAFDLSRRRHGALIVLERDTGLQDYMETGVAVDATVTPELLEGIFFPNSPLHDGAAIIRGDRIAAAACTLPLSENRLPEELGTRHRAAVGVTERTDAVSVVVSEETGRVSIATDGKLVYRARDEHDLRDELLRLLGSRNGAT